MLVCSFSQPHSHSHTQTEYVSLSSTHTQIELVVHPSTGPETASAVSRISAEKLAQLCKEIRAEFGYSVFLKDEDTPEDEDDFGKLLNKELIDLLLFVILVFVFEQK